MGPLSGMSCLDFGSLGLLCSLLLCAPLLGCLLFGTRGESPGEALLRLGSLLGSSRRSLIALSHVLLRERVQRARSHCCECDDRNGHEDQEPAVAAPRDL